MNASPNPKTAVVTGASSGIGKATAKAQLAEGYRVVVAARRLEKMRDLEALGATAIAMDITVDAQVVALVDAVNERFGGADILINNAGFATYGAMEDTSMADARYQFEVNLFGLARLTQLLLPKMREKGAGTIINISSMGGEIHTPLGAWYHATKFALEGWSDCLRMELQPFGIHVVIVEPGLITTEFGDVMNGPLLKRSGTGPYAELTQAVATATRASYEEGAGSPPSLIAKTIVGALRRKRPKTRYVAGKMARPVMFMRRWLSDRLFDRAIMSQF